MAEREEHPATTLPGTYLVGDLQVDLWRGQVRREHDVVSIGGQPLAILAALLEGPGRSLGREELQRRLWPDEPFGDLDQRLNAAVRLLRRALGDSSDEPRYLETLRGRGYRICADVEPVDPGEAVVVESKEPVGKSSTSAPERAARSTPGAWILLVAASLVVLVALVAAFSGDSDPLENGQPEPGTHVGEAYREFLSAMRRVDDQDMATATRHAEAAVSLDPEYTAAWVLVGRLRRAGGDPEGAAGAFLRAIDIDPSFTDAHLSLGNHRFWNQWNWGEAEASFVRARNLAPRRAEVHHSYAWFLLASRRFEEAAASMERALELDPMSAVLHSDFGWFQYRMRNYPAALRYCHAALDLEPTLGSALDCRHRALARLGDYDRALESALQSSAVPESVQRRLRGLPVGVGYREFLVHLDDTGSEISRFVRAMNLAAADRTEAAIRQLELAVRERDSLLVLIDVTPEFDALVPDERFQRLRRAVRGPRRLARVFVPLGPVPEHEALVEDGHREQGESESDQ